MTARLQRGLLASLVVGTTAAATVLSAGAAHAAEDRAKASPTGYLYTSTNDIDQGSNDLAGFAIWPNGKLTPLKQGQVRTGGTGVNNGYIPSLNIGNAKLGPMDNDTPVVSTPNGKFVYTVNGHSDTIAGFRVIAGGKLVKVPGSPFKSGGINPNSLSVNPAGTLLAVSNRNEDPARQDLLRSGKPSVSTFRIAANGALTPAGTADVAPAVYGAGTGNLPTQVLFPYVGDVLFVNNFRVDAIFPCPDGVTCNQRWAETDQVNGDIQSLIVGKRGALAPTGQFNLPPVAGETVPNIPLNSWAHPKKRILYTDTVINNGVGVMTYDEAGRLSYVTRVDSDSVDVCWLRTNQAGTRLYQISNLAKPGTTDVGSSIEVYDISGDNALKPVLIQRVSLPNNGTEDFVNDRGATQAGSTAFHPTLSPDDKYFYVSMQRVNQVPSNTNPNGNVIVGYKINADGTLGTTPVTTVELAKVGFPTDSRAWGLAAVAAK